MAQGSVKKVVLAYSGGLDTSIILKWLQTTYGCEVVTFTADLGQGEAPFSVDANLLHASSEGKVLEDPSQEVPPYVYSRTNDPESAPDKPTYVSVAFEKGDAVALDGKALSPAQLLAALNTLGRQN